MWLVQLILECWGILTESAAFILVGFVLAALLHVVLARTQWVRWLQGLGTRSVLLASAVGLPLPLCSCSVLPAAISLRRQGASKGATLSFLISTPETSVQSVLLTYSLIGPILAVFRPVAATVTALVAGMVENFAERRFPSHQAESAPDDSERSCATCAEEPAAASTNVWLAGFRHAFIDIFDDIVGWMLIGIAVAAAIKVAIPAYVIDAVFGPPLQAMLVMLAIGIPLYVCAEASTPIAAVLLAQGVSPGAALVFLLAGPATNIGAVGVLARHLGRRTVVIYLATIAVVSLAMGLALEWFLGARGVRLTDRALAEPFVPPWIKAAGAVVFLVLCMFSMKRLKYGDRFIALLDAMLPVRVTRARILTTGGAALVAGYIASGLFVIEPGQAGMVKRFGRLVRGDVPPGLHFALPYPICSVDKIETGRVWRLDLGLATTAAGGASQEAQTESWVLLGDENIANVKCAVHWHMREGDVTRFAYGTADRDRLVRETVTSTLRQVLGGANIETALTTDQVGLGQRIHAEAQEMLDGCASGIEVISFSFLDLHAPPEVHDAFRDIASALEDKSTRRNEALAFKARIEPLAYGTRQQLIGEAQGYQARTAAEAAGQADAFLQTLAAFEQHPDLTRTRLLHEMYDRVLPGLRKCIKPNSGNLYLDLRFGGKQQEQDVAF